MTTTSDVRYRTEEDPVWRAAYSSGVGNTFEAGEMLLILTEAHSQDEFVAIERATNQGKSILMKAGIGVSNINDQDEQGLLVHDTRVDGSGQDISVQVILSMPKP